MLANLGYGPWAGLWGYVSRPQRPSVTWAAGSGQRGWAVEPELEVEVARSPFELWPLVLLTGKPCRTAELQSGVALVSNPRLICAAYRGKLNRLFQDEYS